jgi:hypothetical protein
LSLYNSMIGFESSSFFVIDKDFISTVCFETEIIIVKQLNLTKVY